MVTHFPFYDPVSGRGISERTFFDRVERYSIEREQVADRLNYTLERIEQARTARQESYWDREFRSSRELLSSYDAALEDMQRQAEIVYEPEIQEPEHIPEHIESFEDDEDQEPASYGEIERYFDDADEWGDYFDIDLDDVAFEWEFGQDYDIEGE